jgi:hypothetical protein
MYCHYRLTRVDLWELADVGARRLVWEEVYGNAVKAIREENE